MRKLILSALTAAFVGFLVISVMNLIHEGNLRVFESLLGVKPSAYLIPFLIFTASYLVEALRMNVVLKAGGYGISFVNALVNNVVGYTFSYLTPFAMGGQPFQVYHLSKLGVDSGYATGLMAARILENSIGSAVIAIIVLNTSLGWIIMRGRIVFVGIGISLSASTVLIISMARPSLLIPLVNLVSRISRKDLTGRFREWVERFKTGLELMWKKKIWVMMVDISLWFVALSMQLYSLYYALEKVVGKSPGFWKVFGLINAVNALAYFIPTPGSSGGIEATYQLVLSSIFGNPDDVLLSITVWRIVAYYAQIILGLMLIWKIGKDVLNSGNRDLNASCD